MADRRVLEFNGMAFEHMIVRYLSHRYPEARFFTNLNLFSSFLGKATQIDVIMVCEMGVFVVEAKGWRRWIRGSYDDEYWTGQSSTMNTILAFNPVHQNIIHIRSLRNAIRVTFDIDVAPFENVVCIPDGTIIDSPCREVCNLSLLGTLIDSIILQKKYHIDVDAYYKYIETVTD